MHIAVIGSGGREAALALRLRAEGNTTAQFAAPTGDLASFCGELQALCIELAVIGPEAPLAAGLADALRSVGVATVGPGQGAAQLEASKSWAKGFMARHGVATAPWRAMAVHQAELEAPTCPLPVVVKRDGLCGGKGVSVCRTPAELVAALQQAHDRDGPHALVVLEHLLVGRELSLHALVSDGQCVLLPAAMDHKRLFDQDLGPNTGGMGAVAPLPWCTPQLLADIESEVIAPTLRGLQAENIGYRGVLYFGLMLTRHGPRLLEYNVRFGDPECQVLLPLIATNLANLLMAVARGELRDQPIAVQPGFAAAVVLAAPGYPHAPQLGTIIDIPSIQDLTLAGMQATAAGWQTCAGRVATAVGQGPSLDLALKQAYCRAEPLAAQGLLLRRDIGAKAKPARVAVLASGRGSNLAALIAASGHGILQGFAQIELALFDRGAPGQSVARAAGIATHQLDSTGISPEQWAQCALPLLHQYGIEVVVLAGFARILASTLIAAYPARILNIHPADPVHYVGLHGYRWAFAQQLPATTITVHLVDAGLDSGPILAQEGVDLRGAQSLAQVEARGLQVEHRLYPQTLRNFLLEH